MSNAPFRIAELRAGLDRALFNSGSAPLDRYFTQQVTQEIRRRIAACFVALTPDDQVAGFYTLASASVLLAELPTTIRQKLPRYPSVPAVCKGRLAIDLKFRGRGLGAALLADALDRSTRSEIAAYALVVDAKDEQAAAFYSHHGFIALPDSPMKLFLPLKTVQGLG